MMAEYSLTVGMVAQIVPANFDADVAAEDRNVAVVDAPNVVLAAVHPMELNTDDDEKDRFDFDREMEEQIVVANFAVAVGNNVWYVDVVDEEPEAVVFPYYTDCCSLTVGCMEAQIEAAALIDVAANRMIAAVDDVQGES